MQKMVNFRRAAGLMAGVMMVAFTALAVGMEFDRAAPLAPSDLPQFKVGETLSVATENARLMVGSAAVATLARGQHIIVVEVRGPWIGTQISVGGQQKTGWIATADFVSTPIAQTPEPQIRTVSKPVEPQPIETANIYTEPARVGISSNYQDDYLFGYYVRHETDPNLHVWEPWRHSR